MDVLEFTGKTVEEAVAKAERHFNVGKERLDVTVLEEASRGFLGIGARDARIRAVYEPASESLSDGQGPTEAPEEKETFSLAQEERPMEREDNVEDIGVAFLAPVFKQLAIDPVVTVSETDDEIRFDVKGDDVGILIGRRGETLNALQYLLSLAVNRQISHNKRVILDCENYRERRAQTLEQLALRMSDKARETGRRVSLEPMSAAERRIVHLALDGVSGIKVESIGEEPNRRIVIYPQR